MADKYSRSKYIDDLVSSGEFSYEEAKKYADEYERGAPTKVEKPASAAISEPSPAEVQSGLKDMTTAREEQGGMTFGQKVGLGAGAGAAIATGSYLLGKKSGIKDRMIGSGTTIEPMMDVNQEPKNQPALTPEKPMSAKAASLAEQFQAEYGIPLSEVEKHYQVPIKDMQEARLLGGAYKSNMAPATASNVIPGAPSMNAGAVPSPTGQVPVGVPPTTPAMPEPTLTTAPAAPVIEVPVVAATEADVPATKTETSKTGVAPPEGMREQYSKGKKNPIGPSAFNHLANNLGLEKAKEVWESTYGKKNVPYEQYMSEYSKSAGKDMPGPRQPLPEGAKPGGAFGKPQYIPEYIKGGATPGGMTAAGGAALGAYLAAPSIENAIKSGKEGDAAMSASYLSNLLDLHPATAIANALFGLSPEELKTLRNSKQAKTVGSGRGVAPPSAYQR